MEKIIDLSEIKNEISNATSGLDKIRLLVESHNDCADLKTNLYFDMIYDFANIVENDLNKIINELGGFN